MSKQKWGFKLIDDFWGGQNAFKLYMNWWRFYLLPVALSCQQTWHQNNPFLTHPIARISIPKGRVLYAVAAKSWNIKLHFIPFKDDSKTWKFLRTIKFSFDRKKLLNGNEKWSPGWKLSRDKITKVLSRTFQNNQLKASIFSFKNSNFRSKNTFHLIYFSFEKAWAEFFRIFIYDFHNT
jgi:hypothetical protein